MKMKATALIMLGLAATLGLVACEGGGEETEESPSPAMGSPGAMESPGGAMESPESSP